MMVGIARMLSTRVTIAGIGDDVAIDSVVPIAPKLPKPAPQSRGHDFCR